MRGCILGSILNIPRALRDLVNLQTNQSNRFVAVCVALYVRNHFAAEISAYEEAELSPVVRGPRDWTSTKQVNL